MEKAPPALLGVVVHLISTPLCFYTMSLGYMITGLCLLAVSISSDGLRSCCDTVYLPIEFVRDKGTVCIAPLLLPEQVCTLSCMDPAHNKINRLYM